MKRKPTLGAICARANVERGNIAGWTPSSAERCFWGAVAYALTLRMGCELLGYGARATDTLVSVNVKFQGTICGR